MSDNDIPMTPNRPYLIRGLYEWIADNNLTPHLLVDATADGVDVPPDAIKEDKVVLNVSTTAVRGLQLGNTRIDFHARFSGRDQRISLPTGAVLAIYARENGQGMLFPEDDQPPPTGPKDGGDEKKGPNLRVVK